MNKSNKRNQLLLVIGIIFIAFNLRPAITSVGPIIDAIRSDLGISNGVAGFITTVPLISFAILSIFAPKLGHAFGNERTVFFGLIVLVIGILLRSTGYIGALFIGTAFIGVGIAIGNVLLPGIVKMKFPDKVGILTSTYSTSMNCLAALGSGLSIPLAVNLGLGWQKALAFWSILTILALIVWIPQARYKTMPIQTAAIEASNKALWRSSIAWQVTLFMGLQSFLFYCTVAWLPEILQSYGIEASLAGWLLSFIQLIGLPTTFLAPVIASRFTNQKGIASVIGIFSILGFLGLIVGTNKIILIISIVLLGISQGSSISLALTMIGLRTETAKQAAELSGMAQSVGYLLAAIGPILIGFLFDLNHSWLPPLIVLLIVSILMVIAGIGAGRNQYVLKRDVD